MLQGWISSCETPHKVCCTSDNRILPTRLIDVGDEIFEHARVITTSDLSFYQLDSKSARYIALSYCWGSQSKGADLCIIQGRDDEARLDWETESSRMADIYGDAWLTVAAAWGSNMHDGISATRPNNDTSNSLDLGLSLYVTRHAKAPSRLFRKVYRPSTPWKSRCMTVDGLYRKEFCPSAS